MKGGVDLAPLEAKKNGNIRQQRHCTRFRLVTSLAQIYGRVAATALWCYVAPTPMPCIQQSTPVAHLQLGIQQTLITVSWWRSDLGIGLSIKWSWVRFPART